MVLKGRKSNWGNDLYRSAIKRVLDIIFGWILLVLCSPIMLILAVWIKLDSKGPVLFKQERIGKSGKPFIIYKFRTMSISAPQGMPTSEFTDALDYITKSGQVMRKTSLDELPQLLNVIRGDMSFIGPRPLLAKEEKVHKLRHTNGAEAIVPGITGLAQVRGRDEISDIQKANYDGEYAKNISLHLDIKIICKTFADVIQSRGVHDGKKS